MSSVWIRKRTTRTGEKRYQVLYRRGGRAWPVEAAGTFPRETEARLRRDFVAGELAGGRHPRESLATALGLERRRTIAEWYTAWFASLVDLDERTKVNHQVHWKRISPTFGPLEPAALGHADVQEWISAQAPALSPASLGDYLGTLRQVLDYAGADPNPARDRRLRLPAREDEPVTPPSAAHVLALLARLPQSRRLLFAFLEQTGVRVSEATAWTWGDLDIETSRILSRAQTVKGRRGHRRPRWVQVPAWLLDLLLEDWPPDERAAERPLFLWTHAFAQPAQGVAKAMGRACAVAKIPHFHPHDLRHRRISLWHAQHIPAREVGERVGQKRISTTLDTYTHVMPLDEIPVDAYQRLLRGPDREPDLAAELARRARDVAGALPDLAGEPSVTNGGTMIPGKGERA